MKINNRIYNVAIIVQFILLLHFIFKDDSSEKYNYPDSRCRLEDYRECSRKLDSTFLERRNKDSLKDNSVPDSLTRRFTKYNRNINFIDTVKVSYPGKDGVIITKYYPLHKTIID